MKKQIAYLISKLGKLYGNSALSDQDTQKEYYSYLQDLDEKKFEFAIDEIIKSFIPTSSKPCPTVAEIRQVYSKYKSESNENLEDCNYCDNEGFKLYKKRIENFEYTFLAYCDKCKRGIPYKYDGRKCKNYPSQYVAPSISEIF